MSQFISLYKTAVVCFVYFFSCIPPTQCKVYYISVTAELSAWKQNADFIWKPIALNLENFYAKEENV